MPCVATGLLLALAALLCACENPSQVARLPPPQAQRVAALRTTLVDLQQQRLTTSPLERSASTTQLQILHADLNALEASAKRSGSVGMDSEQLEIIGAL